MSATTAASYLSQLWPFLVNNNDVGTVFLLGILQRYIIINNDDNFCTTCIYVYVFICTFIAFFACYFYSTFKIITVLNKYFVTLCSYFCISQFLWLERIGQRCHGDIYYSPNVYVGSDYR